MSAMGMRVLGRLRLSRSSDESTSIERQREVIEQWSNAHGHTVIGWAEDQDVSGSVDPFDTPQFGDWLNNRAPEFDVICAWKLDRLGRNAIQLNKLFGWCNEHGKTLVSCSESIDLGSWAGRMLASVIAGLAEGELEAIRERQRSSRAKLRQLARWHGGRPPYGYRADDNPDGPGKVLVIDKNSAAVVRRIVDAALAEYPLTRLAHELTAEGVPTPVNYYRRKPGGKWSPTVMRNMLQSRALLGYVHQTVHSPACKKHWSNWCRANCAHETVRDDDGRPLQMSYPLVTLDEYQRIQARLGLIKQSRANVKRPEASPLSGVVICADCASILHHDTTKVDKYTYRNYRCRPCSVMVKAERVESEVEKEFLAQLRTIEVRERVWVRGDSHEAALAEAVTALDELSAAAGRAKSATAKQRLQAQLDAIDERIAELESSPAREGRWEYVTTGQTYGDAWAAADTDQRRELLIRSGISVTASRLSIHLNVPAEIASLVQGHQVSSLPGPSSRSVPV